MAVDPIAIGIKKLIDEKGLLQKAVATKAGFTPQQFSDMLNDRRILRAIDIVPIANALGVEVSDIYEAGRQSA